MDMVIFGQVIDGGFDHSTVRQAGRSLSALDRSALFTKFAQSRNAIGIAECTKDLGISMKMAKQRRFNSRSKKNRDELSFAQFMGCSKFNASSNLEISGPARLRLDDTASLSTVIKA